MVNPENPYTSNTLEAEQSGLELDIQEHAHTHETQKKRPRI